MTDEMKLIELQKMLELIEFRDKLEEVDEIVEVEHEIFDRLRTINKGES